MDPLRQLLFRAWDVSLFVNSVLGNEIASQRASWLFGMAWAVISMDWEVCERSFADVEAFRNSQKTGVKPLGGFVRSTNPNVAAVYVLSVLARAIMLMKKLRITNVLPVSLQSLPLPIGIGI